MSKLRCSSIKGLNVPANGPEINMNKFSHGQPLDLGGANISTGSLTISNVTIGTSTTTTMNATNLVAEGRGQINLNGSILEIPAGTDAERPSSPVFGMMRVNTTQGIVEMYTNKGGTPQWEKLG